jgi:predicted DNA binding CopG/RHH family protein
MKRPIQMFSKDYLDQIKKITPSQAAEFVENYQRMIHSVEDKRKSISIRIPVNLLDNFKLKAKSKGTAYQTQIVNLMREWIASS